MGALNHALNFLTGLWPLSLGIRVSREVLSAGTAICLCLNSLCLSSFLASFMKCGVMTSRAARFRHSCMKGRMRPPWSSATQMRSIESELSKDVKLSYVH